SVSATPGKSRNNADALIPSRKSSIRISRCSSRDRKNERTAIGHICCSSSTPRKTTSRPRKRSIQSRKRCKGRCVPDMDFSPADNKAVAGPVRRSVRPRVAVRRARDRGAAGTTILPSGLFQHGDTEIYARSLRGSQMKLAQKVKIALDETRMLVLGAQILLGF